jgi:zinc protease
MRRRFGPRAPPRDGSAIMREGAFSSLAAPGIRPNGGPAPMHRAKPLTACLLLALLALLALAVLPATAAAPKVTTLENGLTVIVDEYPVAPVVSVRFFVRTGSVYEGKWLGAGISHFAEHTISGGTPTRTDAEINSIIESIGNSSNAFTSTDQVCYYVSTSSEYVDTALDVLGDYVFNATFPEEIVERERAVILREMAMDDDEPGRRIWDLFDETMFLRHPCRARVIGYPEMFKAVTRDDLLEYHKEMYTPENTVLVVSGDTTAEHVVAKCEELFGAIPRRPAQVPILPDEPEQTSPRERVVVDETLDQAHLFMGFRTVDLLDEDLFPLDVLAYVLAHGGTSRMVRELREGRGLVNSIGAASFTPPGRPGSFVVMATLDPKNLDETKAAILDELRLAKEKKVTPEELARAKAEKAAELVFGKESAESRADAIGSDYLGTGNASFSEYYVERIRQVTAEQVQAVAQRYFDETKLCTALLTPKAPKRAARESAATTGGEVEKITLGNGLTVLLGPSPTVPIVSIVTATWGGLRAETKEDNGICSLMSDCLLRGTKAKTREQIAATLEDVGGGIGTYAGRNSFGVTAGCLSQDLPTALNLVAEVLTQATFPEEEFERQKQLVLQGLAAEHDDAFATAQRVFSAAMYLVHPYGMMPSGTEASVSALTRDDVLAFYQERCRPNQTVLAVYGDFDPAEAKAAIERALAKWPASEKDSVWPDPEPPLEQSRTVTEHSDQQQSVVFIGFPGPRIGDDDYYTREVLDAMLSGKSLPGGPLHDTLRGKGLVYLVHGFSVDGIEPGHFAILAATAPQTTDEAIATIHQVVEDFKAAMPTDEALATGKSMCIAEDALGRQEASARAQEAALDELYGQGYDRADHYAERILAVTAEDVHRVANELLNFDRCVTVIVGPQVESSGK